MTNVVPLPMDAALQAAQAKALASLSRRPVVNGGALPEVEEKQLLFDAGDWLAENDHQVWLVDKMIQRGSLNSVTAATNHGKTAIMLLLALCVATGRRFAGRDISTGNVLILCGEDANGFRPRMRATMERLGLEREDVIGRVTVMPWACPLREYLDQIAKEVAQSGLEYSMVLVDTSVAYFTGDSEDDNIQARNHAMDLRELTKLPGSPAVMVNCHPTKGGDLDSLKPRGGGAFLNEIDTNYTVVADGDTAVLHWQQKKRGPDFDQLPFEFIGATIEEGSYKTQTVVAWPITDERAAEMRRARNQDEDRLMWAMQHHPTHHFAQWASDCGWNGEASKSKVHRVMGRLISFKYAEKFRGHYRLTKIGELEAQKIN